MIRRALTAAGLVLAGLACAQRGAPPGGPIDNSPPEIVAVSPADSATGVLPDVRPTITFSEKVDRKSVERALRVFPNPGRVETKWFGNELELGFEPGAPFGPQGERVIVVMAGASDRRGNALGEPLEFAYTTGESLPTGTIEGELTGAAGRATGRVLLVPAPGPPFDSLAAAVPWRETSRGSDGTFRFRYLPRGPDTLALFGLAQEKLGSEIDPDRDRIAAGPDTLTLAAAATVSGITLNLVRLEAPGSVAGRLPPDSLARSVRLLSAADTLGRLETEVDSTGAFLVESVPIGRYRIVVRDEGSGTESPLPEGPDSVRVRPGEAIRLPGADPPPALADSMPSDTLEVDRSRAPADTGRGESP